MAEREHNTQSQEPGDNSRRGFIGWILKGGTVGLLGAVLYPVYRYLVPPKQAEAKVSQVKLEFTRADIEQEPSKSKLFKFGRSLGIIFLTGKGELHALSAICTHLDCTVQNRPDLQLIWCACHNGRYDYQGHNISGPPPRPLEQYAVNEVDGTIFVSKENA